MNTDGKIRLRIGYKVPVFKNAGVAVIRVPLDVAHKIIDAFATIRLLGMAYAPQIVGNLVCEES